MKRQEFVEKVAKKVELPKNKTNEVIDAVLETIQSALKSGDEVRFVGFGTFKTIKRAARKAKIPGTNKEVSIPATRAVKFQAGKQLKESVKK